ncbi:hypothetical protein AAZX31_09G045400 [Glycine max]|uniref:mTERF protein n=1 Tax=Glycine max TaxID=3847 RepID=K7LBT5_SOYBN|nr:uncharacterized protein LOC102663414 [Glycine max]KAG4990521.1 hypothetical protein JHK87_023978 [Glycine soja]KAG5006045.1 hypothetical protein JHK85_024587 [Glycine max]KAG5011839.1 hypothetical protein JHK86_024100 [Glycine max]KAG5132836.1 hypothetical protein JHK82_024024 [Glycine max]KAH1041472.1 hypothetical protein GYH30_024037 [Glycine max]|eukprot:XP_006586932.1 uncharacterized protein LOC102663414 [Glycine max]
MFNKLLYLKDVTFTATSRYPFIHHHSPLLFPLRFYTTTTSNSHSFAVSYLIHNFGFSPESASRTCDSYRICFRTPEKPDSAIRFLRDHGFSNSQINSMVRRVPWLLSCDPCKRVLPKFQFLLSKGVSSSTIVDIVSKSPAILSRSLENTIVPSYDLVFRFLKSDDHTISCLFGNCIYYGRRDYIERNIRVLLDNGVGETNIARLLRNRCRAVFTSDILKVVEEVKDLGFDPSKSAFVTALLALKSMSQTSWKEKVGVYKKWGWSDEACLEAFRRHPHCMLASIDKINTVMNFWVNQLGWDSLDLVRSPKILGLSMEKTIIPRALVVQYLVAKGLRKKSACFHIPFAVSKKAFMEKYVICYKEDAHQLLKLYQEKNSVQGKNEDCAASGSYQVVNS